MSLNKVYEQLSSIEDDFAVTIVTLQLFSLEERQNSVSELTFWENGGMRVGGS